MASSKGIQARAKAICITICHQLMELFSAHIKSSSQSTSQISDHYPTPDRS
jgi:hypothetical protein